MSCQQVPTTPAFNPYPRSVQVGEFEVAIGGGIWVAIRGMPSHIHSPIPISKISDRTGMGTQGAISDFPKRAAQASKRKVQATSGQLQRLRVGWLRRQWRKLLVEIRAWL